MVRTDPIQQKMKTHKQIIESFLQEGKGGNGTNVVAKEKDQAVYSRYRRPWDPSRHEVPLAVRLKDGGFLANGASLDWPRRQHQELVLRALEGAKDPFGVVPFDSITAAWTDGEIRDWNRAPFTLKDLRREVSVVVPSTGEEWREVSVKDKLGRDQTRRIHTLGDSVIRVRDGFYLSGVDETGLYRGIYFLARLLTDRPPASFQEALNFLKPKVVQDAEARGAYVRRQGEWFAIPTNVLTSQLMGDVERGLAVRHEEHILGRDGHHQLEEAIIYRGGPQRGTVFARGQIAHTANEHIPLELGFRWHQIVHNVQGASYSLVGKFD
ncbi:MAG: hypothetical protein C5B51_14855 [Terriglobia bacterium]|nr:MAG: hypothetical protein C5B51_14855 [Terriglobia bacterium]